MAALVARAAAAAAAVLVVAVIGVYVAIMRDQGDAPPVWVLTLFLAGAGAACVAAARPATQAALVALVVLVPMSLLSLLSIGVLLLPSILLLVVAYVLRPALA